MLSHPAAQRRDSKHPPDSLARESVARRPTEIHKGGLDALGLKVRGHEPEHGVGTRERPSDDVDVAVRPLHDLEAPPYVRREAGGVARDHRAIPEIAEYARHM
jgi:hypothetical protein